jgi:hypothetical protein
MLVKEIFNLTEMSIAREGDYISQSSLGILSNFVKQNKYLKLDDFKVGDFVLELIQMENHYKIIQEQEDTNYKIIVECDLSDEHFPNVNNLKNVDLIQVINTQQGKGIAKQLYRYFVKKLKFNILGDLEQFFGARKLWASLSKDTDIIVDIIDLKNKTIVEKSVKLHHGSYDADFDDRIWSYGNDKAHLRLILKDL